jgi:glycosyltransferase involved in cell wall biosynthesis
MKPNPPAFCVFEDDPSGHRLALVELLIRHLHQKTNERPLLLLSDKVKKSKQYQVFLKKIEPQFELELLAPIPQWTLPARFRRLVLASKGLEARGVKTLLIPTADLFVRMAGLARFAGIRFSPGLQVRCGLLSLGAAYPGLPLWRRVKHGLSFWLHQRAGTVNFYHDDYAVDFLNRRRGLRLQAVPDPPLGSGVRGKKSSRGAEPLYFGCLGGLDKRKGVHLLVEAFGKAKFQAQPRLLLAGTISDPGILAKVEALRASLGKDRVVHWNEFLSDRAYFQALQKMDVVCLLYPQHLGASGVFAQAAQAGKWVIAPDWGWMGWHGKKYNKCRLYRGDRLEDILPAMEEIEQNFRALSRVRGNYIPTSAREYAGILSGIG